MGMGGDHADRCRPLRVCCAGGLEMSTEQQAKFEGWAIVEMMGHRKEIGYVTTEYYGGASLLRVDTPGFDERDYEIKRPQWMTIEGRYREVPAGSKVRRSSVPPRSVLVGPSSIYALNPCDEQTARKAIESTISSPLILLSVPEGKQLKAGDDYQDADDQDSDGDADAEN